MSPIAVMHTGKSDALGPEVQRGEHHVGGVEGVDEVWREPVLVLRLGHLFHRDLRWRKTIKVFHVHGDATDTLLLGDKICVGLDNWQSERRDPGDIFAAAGDHVSAFSQPVLDLL